MVNNTIIEVKNTLEGINNTRTTEAEDQMSELEDRMVEITAKEQNKVKRMKRIKGSLRDLWDILNAPTLELQGSQKKRKRKSMRKFLKIIVKNFPNMEKKIVK